MGLGLPFVRRVAALLDLDLVADSSAGEPDGRATPGGDLPLTGTAGGGTSPG